MLPIIDLSTEPTQAAAHLRAVCREHGFFYLVGHGVPSELQERLDRLSRQFFALPLEEKMALRMELGGKAWRGFFPVGQELTAGQPDQKEGLPLSAPGPRRGNVGRG